MGVFSNEIPKSPHLARILAALKNTPPLYLKQTLARHSPPSLPDGMSILTVKPDDIAEIAKRSGGSLFEYAVTRKVLEEVAEHAALMEIEAGSSVKGCAYFRLAIPGTVRMTMLSALPDDMRVTLMDPKKTAGSPGGGVSAYVPGIAVASSPDVGIVTHYSTMIVGPDEDKLGAEVVYTIHPGHPIARPDAANDPKLDGQVVSVAAARALGLTHALFL